MSDNAQGSLRVRLAESLNRNLLGLFLFHMLVVASDELVSIVEWAYHLHIAFVDWFLI